MEHESNNSGSFAELPPPQDKLVAGREEGPAAQPEIAGNQTSMPASTPSTQVPAADSTTNGVTLPVDPSQQSAGQNPAIDDSAMIADDADLIEKEWVVKAKAIVAETKDDPHNQNKQMNKVKADYLKKRYNKDLKLNEG